MMKYLDKGLVIFIAILIAVSVSFNLYKQYSIDRTKLPSKLELHSRFQRWITNLKEKEVNLEGDNFRFKEENNVFNSIWTSTDSIDNDKSKQIYDQNMEDLSKIKESFKSPNEREIVNYSSSDRFGFLPNEVFFYGLREDRILRTKVADCPVNSNCLFHRGAFIDNHVFFVMELSLKNFDKNNPKTCKLDEICEYTFKVHLIDLMNNSRTVYESQTVNDSYNNIIQKL